MRIVKLWRLYITYQYWTEMYKSTITLKKRPEKGLAPCKFVIDEELNNTNKDDRVVTVVIAGII